MSNREQINNQGNLLDHLLEVIEYNLQAINGIIEVLGLCQTNQYDTLRLEYQLKIYKQRLIEQQRTILEAKREVVYKLNRIS